MKNCFSFIIPVFNIELSLIDICISSIRNQISVDDEIIIVDDGSNNTVALYLDNFVDENIFVIHKKNGGVSSARNVGLKEARNLWVWFVDPDDYILDFDLNKLKNKLNEENDFYIMGYALSDNNNVSFQYFFKNIQDKNQLYLALNGFNPQETTHLIGWGTPWSQIYNRFFLLKNSIFFDEKCIRMQDNVFNMYCVKYSKRIQLLDEKIYVYRYEHCVNYFKNYKKSMTEFLPYISEKKYIFYLTERANNQIMLQNSKFTFFCLLVLLRKCIFSKKSDFPNKKGLFLKLNTLDSFKSLREYSKYFSMKEKVLIKLFLKKRYYFLKVLFMFYRGEK